jgi:hypothetical protein
MIGIKRDIHAEGAARARGNLLRADFVTEWERRDFKKAFWMTLWLLLHRLEAQAIRNRVRTVVDRPDFLRDLADGVGIPYTIGIENDIYAEGAILARGLDTALATIVTNKERQDFKNTFWMTLRLYLHRIENPAERNWMRAAIDVVSRCVQKGMTFDETRDALFKAAENPIEKPRPKGRPR